MSISRILGNTAQSHTEETAMHHAISYHLAHARTAALHHHVRSDTRTRAFPAPPKQASPPWRVRHPLAEPAPPAA